MIVRVSDIPEQGLQIDSVEALPRPFADPSWTLEDLALLVRKDGDDVLVEGRLVARVPQVCGRCLEPYQLTLEPAVSARFVPGAAAKGEQELAADDLETDVYDHDQLDLARLVETETQLGLPMKPLCRDGCRGLCPVCGGNRNVAACGCPDTAADVRWAPLKKLAERLSR